MKEIICYSKKYGNQTALVDDADFETINKHRWNVASQELKNNKSTDEKIYKFYPQTNVRIEDNIYCLKMHQMILGKVEKGFVIDHMNGNSLDNTRSNLRIVTCQSNCQNRKPINKYIGISLNKKSKKYRSKALSKHIGYFDDEKTAAEAYDKYIIRNIGEESLLNFKYTQLEIEKIKNEVIKDKKTRELPSNIRLTSNNTYKVEINFNNYKKCKNFKTLEMAITFKNKCQEEIKKLEEEKQELYYKNPITYNSDGIAYIIVKYKKEEYQCLVDAEKWHDLSLISWHFDGKYVKRWHKNRKQGILHRYLYQLYFPDIDISDKIIDHIDGKDELSKRLDNRISNLRIVTAGENAYNKETKSKCGYRGVQKRRNKFYSMINHNNKKYFSKGFSTLEEAALAYNEMAVKYYGNIAKLNVIKK